MKRIRIIVTLLLLALWLPATNHCRLEQISVLSFLVCCDREEAAPGQGKNCETDGCALVENGFYKSDDIQETLVVPPLLVGDFIPTSVEDLPQPSTGLFDFCTVASLELSVTWQFSCRAAAPPRAPSFAS